MSKVLTMIALLGLFATHAYAQAEATDVNKPAEDTAAPYMKYNRLPAFNIMMPDSVTIFNTYNIPDGKRVALFFFSPDCGHCHRTTQRIIDSMEMLQDVMFYMFTPMHDMNEIEKFKTRFRLNEFKNIVVVGRDYEFFFGSYYKVRVVPDIALYDAHKKFVKLIQGESSAQAIYDAYH